MNWFKELKTRYHLTQQKFSDITGIPKSTVEAWERGTRNPPEWLPKMIEAYLASVLSVD
ncbi:MAG: helix-turn-helix domain-containing protein [Roseburia sp.]|nr:helix-turn-helix domain-containing protein [Roseburia sp.]